MKESQWLTEATRRIAFGPDRRAVRAELFDHIEEAREALKARHPEMTPLETEERAVAAMGDPEPLAREMARLHKPWMGYLWRVSQVLAVLALTVLAGVAVWQLTNKYAQEGPLPYLRELAAWDVGEILPPEEETLAEPVAFPRSGKIRAGGYTVSSPRAFLVTVKPGGTFILGVEAPEGIEPCRALYVELKIGPGPRGEAMDLSRAVSRVADSTGKVYELGWEGPARWLFKTTHPWGELAPLGQRALLALWSVPEGANWVDITFGWGEKAGTLRVELSEVDT